MASHIIIVRPHTYRLEIEGEPPSRKGGQGEMERMERRWTNEASWTHPPYLAILMDNGLYRGKWETKKSIVFNYRAML